MIGDLAVFDVLPLSRPLVVCLVILYIFAMAVMLMNLFIGVISDAYVVTARAGHVLGEADYRRQY